MGVTSDETAAGRSDERAEIRRILVEYWDPLGIGGGDSEVTSEYDAAVGMVAAKRRAGASPAVIEHELRRIVVERIGLPNSHIDYPALMRRLAELPLTDRPDAP